MRHELVRDYLEKEGLSVCDIEVLCHLFGDEVLVFFFFSFVVFFLVESHFKYFVRSCSAGVDLFMDMLEHYVLRSVDQIPAASAVGARSVVLDTSQLFTVRLEGLQPLTNASGGLYRVI